MKIKIMLVCLLAAVGSVMASLPDINQRIVEFVKTQAGKKVDRGECWDLAAIALDKSGAAWSTPYEFGIRYDFKKDTILPGDIIQFENAEFKGELYKITMPHHTAVVMEVLEPLKLKIAHQNFAGKKTVQFTELNFNDLHKGEVQFFHPKAK